MKTLYILKGLPASGKSTWSRQKISETPNAYKRINKDDLRNMLDNDHWSNGNEKFVLKIRDLMIKTALSAGKHVISDDTNLSPRHEIRMRQVVQTYCKETGEQVEIIVKFFDVDVEECIKRDLKRARSVGERVIRRAHKEFILPNKGRIEPLEQDVTLPKAVICDLDGTLAIMNRNPYDASTCEQDVLNLAVANIVKNYHSFGHKILLVSGRSDKYQPETKRWLAAHNIPYDRLIMRKEGDFRKDSIMKEETLDQEILGKFYVEFVLDDRNQVVEMWRKRGLLCCQVAIQE